MSNLSIPLYQSRYIRNEVPLDACILGNQTLLLRRQLEVYVPLCKFPHSSSIEYNFFLFPCHPLICNLPSQLSDAHSFCTVYLFVIELYHTFSYLSSPCPTPICLQYYMQFHYFTFNNVFMIINTNR